MSRATLYVGDALEVLRTLEPESFDAIVTDPPYGLKFMGKNWDHGIPGVSFWEAALLVAKPGAHLLAFGGTRTHHRLMCAIEDAGWEIRDCLMWVYGSGFPKSLDVGKAIDKAAGEERVVVGKHPDPRHQYPNTDMRGGNYIGGRPGVRESGIVTAPATDAAKQWDGWGTALKPAWEPIILARKPLMGTVAANVLEHGTGGLNVDGCRIGPGHDNSWGRDGEASADRRYKTQGATNIAATPGPRGGDPTGRWPANVVHDGSEEVVGLFPQTVSGGFPKTVNRKRDHGVLPNYTNERRPERLPTDSGSAARFFYCAKASRAEREAGLTGERRIIHDDKWSTKDRRSGQPRNPRPRDPVPVRNNHPTVKPIALMRWLCRLVTPPNGLILDPFCGSGSTGVAAVLEGFRFTGFDSDPESYEIAHGRITAASAQTLLELA